jgi:vacuolar protein sorting-associated protein 26C
MSVFPFQVSPSSLQNIKESNKRRIPDFFFTGRLLQTSCQIDQPFEGELTIIRSAVDIKSIELQLVRVESCSFMEGAGGEAREATEIQNIQLAEGNVVRGVPLPIYMVFPRLFCCATTVAKGFRVEFEVNLIILFADNHMVTENFPIKLYR